MAKFFTRDEAERLLPELETAIREAIFLKQEHLEADRALQGETQRIIMAGGARVDRNKLLAQRERRDASAAGLQKSIAKVHAFGCLVKDLDVGLVDFPTLFREQEVYLCWKLGEPGIGYWHGVEEGFRGRKPIDRDFLDNHRGDREN
ncbi:MAG TPA: DUF2203 domain-containing protein [Bryobacteraceae bacterium]|nr:DUF2203 domain-containing protein [Bryobacteraceae bacterium]